MNEKNLLKLITIGPILFIPLVVFLIFFNYIFFTQELFNTTTANLKEELVAQQKQNTISKVKMAVDFMVYERSTIEERLKEKVKDRVKQAYAIGQHIYKQNSATKDENSIKKMITDALRPMIWNDGESFIFILDKKGVFTLAPEYLKELEGKSILDFKDATGRYVIQEEIALVSKEGEGFLWDTFTRPKKDPSIQYQQVAFVKDFEMFGLYLGSSEYLDITTKEIEKTALNTLRNVNKNTQGYFFVFDTKGKVILHSTSPELEGQNLLESQSPIYKALSLKLLSKASSDLNDFVSYEWQNPNNGKVETKLSYFQKIPHTEWVIGSGFYTHGIEQIAAEKQVQMQESNDAKVFMLKIYSLLFTLASLGISILISKKLQAKFALLKVALERKSNELQELNLALEEKIGKRTQELENAYAKMKHIANTDSLTQIKNRYSFLNAFNDELKRHKNQQKEFSLLMFDIDYFKHINDTYGHNIGDIVLMEITEVVKGCLRTEDIFGRVGGEEFMIFLPQTPLQEGQEIAQRVRKAVDENNFSVIEHATISLGVVTSRKDEEGAEMFKRVDVALYEAKTQGRNRVCVG
jgi:diguanylate cyclase (GGDEF)-like protein